MSNEKLKKGFKMIRYVANFKYIIGMTKHDEDYITSDVTIDALAKDYRTLLNWIYDEYANGYSHDKMINSTLDVYQSSNNYELLTKNSEPKDIFIIHKEEK